MSCLTDVWNESSEPTYAPVGLPRSLWPGRRDWGLPSLMMPGKMWHTIIHDGRVVLTMVVPSEDPGMVRIERRDLIETAAVMGWPAGWSDAMLEYWEEWPLSADVQRRIMLADHYPWF